MFVRIVSSLVRPQIWSTSSLSLRSLCVTAQQGTLPPVLEVTDGCISIASDDALDTTCHLAEGNEYSDECNICQTCVSGQPVLSFYPSRDSYVSGLYSDVQISACESCVLRMFKAVRIANKDVVAAGLQKDGTKVMPG